MTDDAIKKLNKLESLQDQLTDLSDAILILEGKTPAKYRQMDLKYTDACVSRALDSLDKEECIDAFKRKINKLKIEIADSYRDLSLD